jgi:co-chaperonin GroES (HSP10)
MAVVPAASVARLASLWPSVPAAPVPPTAPVKVVVALSLMVKARAVPSDWSPHKRDARVFALSLGGASITSAQVQSNNLKEGDIIIMAPYAGQRMLVGSEIEADEYRLVADACVTAVVPAPELVRRNM